jgi:hypothetical protein
LLGSVVLTVLGVAGFFALVASALTGGRWWLVVLFLLAIGWMAFNAVPKSYQLIVVDGALSWRSFLGQGTVPLSDVVRVRYLRSMASFELSDGRHVRVDVKKGYAQFIDALARAYPEHERLRTIR